MTILFPGAEYSPGIRFKTTVQRWSWRYDNASLAITLARELSYCGQATSPGGCTCWGKLSWWAVTAGDVSSDQGSSFYCFYKPNHTFDTFRGIFEFFTATERAFWNKKWKIITFCNEQWQIFTYSKIKINPSLLLTREHLFTCRVRKMVPSLTLSYCWVH